MGIFDNVKKMTEGATFTKTIETIKGVSELKPLIISKVVSIDYSKVLNHLNENKKTYPRTDLLIATVQTMQEAAEIHKTSESTCKDNDFMRYLVSNIEPQKVIEELEPVVNLIPMGGIIMMVLKLLLSYKKNQ